MPPLPVFRKPKLPRFSGFVPKAEAGHREGSSRARGYDARWDRLSIAYRKKHPFCLICEQVGRDATPAAVVDHMIPRTERPDLMYAWSNLCSMCAAHHSGFKQLLENYARETGEVDRLPEWVKRPETRPERFRIFGGGDASA